jgi:flagellin
MAMALSILNNIPSLAAQNQLAITGSNLQRTLFRLSSGSRINTGADDAAGLAIADGLHANVTALTQSARNANDGVGFLQVADGALAQVTTLLNRAVTLATESATGSVTQRGALDSEFQAITREIQRIGDTTTYNGTQVFTTNTVGVFLSDSSQNSSISLTTGSLTPTGIGLNAQSTDTMTINTQPEDGDTLDINGKTYTFKTTAAAAGDIQIGNDVAGTVNNIVAALNGKDTNNTTANADVSASAVGDGKSVLLTATSANPGAAGDSLTFAFTIKASSASKGDITDSGSGTFAGGVDGGSLATAQQAASTLASINNAIQYVANMRGSIGANINRLQSASNVMTNQVQNLSAAEDGIRAADIPAEVANLTKYSILNQTAISALAQANNMQQSILKLLQ